MSKIVNRFPPKIKAKKIKFEVGVDNEYLRQEAKESLGNLPFVWYNSYQLDLADLSFFELSLVDNIPSLKIVFADGLTLMRDKGFPLDDTKISIFLNPRTTNLKPIHLDFKIVDFKMMGSTYVCIGLLDAYKLYVKEFKSYPKQTSSELLRDMCKDIGLGFNSNMDNSGDKMTWINPGMKKYEFMNDILDNCYASDQSFILGYIDYYYNYNFIDLQHEIVRDIKQELGIQNSGLEEAVKTQEREVLGRLYLSNDAAFYDSNFYFDGYTVLNKSTKVSISRGYKSIVKYYNQVTKEYLPFVVDSITDNSNSKIILKGAPKDLKFKNENLDYIYQGKLDSDNSHVNYNYAKVHNDRNLYDLEKIGLELSMRLPNYNLYKFQKVYVQITYNMKNIQHEYNNERLSGEWLIIDIKYRYTNTTFKQIITLVKRELELSKEELRRG